MDFGALGDKIPLIVVIIAVIAWQIYTLRKRQPERTQRQITQSLLSAVRLNLVLVETFSTRQKPKKFEMASWQLSKNKLDYLDQSLVVVLSDAFMMAEDFNQQIGVAKKYKSSSYLVNINVDKLKRPLAKSREGLEQWLVKKVGGQEPPPEYPGMFDSLFGRR